MPSHDLAGARKPWSRRALLRSQAQTLDERLPHHATDATVAGIVGGPLLYLLGNALFKWVTNDRRGPPLSHLIGLLLLFVLLPLGLAHMLSALALGATATGILVLVAAWESAALHKPIVAMSPARE